MKIYSARISDYYGVCSRKIGGVVTELRTREHSINNCAIVNIRGYEGPHFNPHYRQLLSWRGKPDQLATVL